MSTHFGALSILMYFSLIPANTLLLGMTCVLKHHDLQMVGLKLNTYNYYYPYQNVGCASETKFQVGDKFNRLTQLAMG